MRGITTDKTSSILKLTNEKTESEPIKRTDQPPPDFADSAADPVSLEEKRADHTGYNSQSVRKFKLISLAAPARPAPGATPAIRAELKTLKSNLPTDASYDGVLVGANGQAYVNADGRRINISAALLEKVPAVGPNKLEKEVKPDPDHKVIYVNGIMTPIGSQFETMKEIANTTGYSVVGVHNSTQGIVDDLNECFNDKFVKDNNLAARSLAKVVLGEVMSGKPVHLMAHSQGGIITSRALNDVYYQLMKNGESKGMNRHQAEQFAENRLRETVRVETFGSAADSYPNGPQYVHYINSADSVPMQCGLGSLISKHGLKSRQVKAAAGSGATIRYFNVEYQIPGKRSDRFVSRWDINPIKRTAGIIKQGLQEAEMESVRFMAPHSIDDVYLRFRDDFTVAQKLGTNFDAAPTHRLKRINLKTKSAPAAWQPGLTDLANKFKSLAKNHPAESRAIERKIQEFVP